MDSMISPIAPPNLNMSGSEKVVTGEIEVSSESVTNVRFGSSLLLNILQTDNVNLSDSIITQLNVRLPEQNVPIELKLDTPLRFPNETPNSIEVKVSAVWPEKIEVKLVSLNNEPLAKFVASPQARERSIYQADQMQGKERESISTVDKPLIVETGTSAKNISFHPLDIAQLVETVARPINMPDNVLTRILTALQGAKINVGLTAFVPENVPHGKNVQPNLEYLSLPELDKPLQISLENMRSVLANFSEQIGKDKILPNQVQDIVQQIKNEILLTQNQQLSGEVIAQPDKNLVAFKTVLGTALPETPLRAEDGSKAVLEIKNISFPERETAFSVTDIISSVKLIKEAMNLPPIMNGVIKQEAQPSIRSVITLLEPLKITEHQDLSAKILQRIPSFENKMLPNTVNFIRGAVSHSLEVWLGKETVQELNAAGAEGAEVAARLENLLINSVREGVNWRQVEIPLFGGEGINKIKIAVKKQSEDEVRKKNNDKNKGGTRFVVDTSFSALGDFQFDGFSQPQDKRFDLIIRTSREVGNDLYSNMLRLFKTTLNNLDYLGNIKINVKENFIKICDDTSHGETLKSGIYI